MTAPATGSALCGGDDSRTEWRGVPAGRYAGKRVTNCCNWAAPVDDCQFQHYSAFDGYVVGIYWRCAPGRGCNVRPGLKRTAHLRWYEPADE